MFKWILDNILPKRVLQKAVKKAVKAYYNGAMNSPSRPSFYDYLKDAHLDISKVEREQIVIKSRDLEKNNAYWPKYLSIHENYTVGRGIPLTPSSSDPKFNDLMKKVFESWSENPLVDSRMDLSEMQRTMARTTARDGEVFILKVWDGKRRKIQILETQRVGYPKTDNSPDTIYDGIELDRLSKPLAYFVRRDMQRLYDPSTVTRIPAWSVYHVYNPERFGQIRGLPLCTNVINDLIDLDLLHKYEMDAAKYNSQKIAAWTRQGDDLEI
ncbi:MAG: phage portal protein, partial [Saccharofermentanales bacterium]